MQTSRSHQPKSRSYQQYCPMASALDVIGDRWALLVVRELMLGPRRFTELAAGLPGIGTDILTARLRGLADAGVLARSGTGRQQHYQLTDRGRALRPLLAELGRWGAARLDPPAAPEQVAARTGLTTLVLDPPPPPARLTGVFDIRCDGQTARVAVTGQLITLMPRDREPAEPATAVIDLTRAGLLGVLAGAGTRDLTERGDLVIRGDRAAGALLIATISGPDVLAALTARLPRR
jgi:DNA-binding HxlR family transcriptional regulator